tara:strand:- start:2461 stop:2664 length:204 start_codon:yes stop_codon:yes gene_type:complete
MRNYSLFNKRLKRKLEHPVIGLWNTPDLDEANEMLAACHEYLNAVGANHLRDDFVVIDVETQEEILN